MYVPFYIVLHMTNKYIYLRINIQFALHHLDLIWILSYCVTVLKGHNHTVRLNVKGFS